MLKLGQLNRLMATFKKAGITHAAMAGAINKTRMYTKIRPDWRAVRFLNRLRNQRDDSLLRALADELESEGIRIQPSTIFLPDLLAPEGILTRRKPNRREQADIAFGWGLAKAIGSLDIDQCRGAPGGPETTMGRSRPLSRVGHSPRSRVDSDTIRSQCRGNHLLTGHAEE